MGHEGCARAEPRGRRSGLAASMAPADNNYVKSIHSIPFRAALANRFGVVKMPLLA
jgi:hypothetical protein